MSRHRDWDITCKVYIGNLGNNASKYELEDAFSKYGPLRNVWVARNPPGFAFVEFEDPRDAEDSVRGTDGTRLCGVMVKAEVGAVVEVEAVDAEEIDEVDEKWAVGAVIEADVADLGLVAETVEVLWLEEEVAVDADVVLRLIVRCLDLALAQEALLDAQEE
eukprot:TCALIF_08291-PA protein Name:"Similar to Rbp1 RNA-binding protein 1 (Drosophila melanogaster)" AED:0.10 eAED:0.58 QI:0/0/0/1/1/1/2/0/161